MHWLLDFYPNPRPPRKPITGHILGEQQILEKEKLITGLGDC